MDEHCAGKHTIAGTDDDYRDGIRRNERAIIRWMVQGDMMKVGELGARWMGREVAVKSRSTRSARMSTAPMLKRTYQTVSSAVPLLAHNLL